MKSACFACFALMLAGCATKHAPVERQATRGLEASERYVNANGRTNPDVAPAAPMALLGETPLTWEELRPRLVEAGGAVALEELVLERLLTRECERLGLSINADDLRAERQRLAEVMGITTASNTVDMDSAERVIDQMRRERGLGDERFASLLKRTAMMRKLVQTEVVVTPAALDQAYQMKYGERYVVRLITVGTTQEASKALQRVLRGEAFEQVAIDVSTDISAIRGGFVEPISEVDPAWPASLRTAITALQPGEVLTSPIALESGYAIVKLERVLESPSVPPSEESVRVELEREVRLRQERLLMNRLARRLLESSGLTIMDPGLRSAWDRRQSR